MRIRILLWLLHTSDPAFRFDADVDRDPAAQYDAQIHAEPERWYKQTEISSDTVGSAGGGR
jgi:hypothetical protein